MQLVWTSPLDTCDVCKGDFDGTMYDAKVGRAWGNVCHSCFTKHGGRLGVGLGQRYELGTVDSGFKMWLCTGGQG